VERRDQEKKRFHTKKGERPALPLIKKQQEKNDRASGDQLIEGRKGGKKKLTGNGKRDHQPKQRLIDGG